jgi:hypothetical protein
LLKIVYCVALASGALGMIVRVFESAEMLKVVGTRTNVVVVLMRTLPVNATTGSMGTL